MIDATNYSGSKLTFSVWVQYDSLLWHKNKTKYFSVIVFKHKLGCLEISSDSLYVCVGRKRWSEHWELPVLSAALHGPVAERRDL